MTKEKISPELLIPMDLFVDTFPLRIELAYTSDDNLLFGERIYRQDAKLWLHEDLAKIILLASKFAAREKNLRMVLYDGLRTTHAQALMLETQRVRDNPSWLEEPVLLSSPGGGGHPRGMAIDVALETQGEELLDMGTAFDFMSEDSSPEHNPAHRKHHHSELVTKNRATLDKAMRQAATLLKTELFPLPEEWWDFRLPPAIINQYAPLSDSDLPPQMRMTDTDAASTILDFDEAHFAALKERLLAEISEHLRSHSDAHIDFPAP